MLFNETVFDNGTDPEDDALAAATAAAHGEEWVLGSAGGQGPLQAVGPQSEMKTGAPHPKGINPPFALRQALRSGQKRRGRAARRY